MFKTTSSIISLIIAIGFAGLTYYLYLEIPDSTINKGRMAASSETDYLSLDYLKMYGSAFGAIMFFFNSAKSRELKKKELELKERELNHKYGKSK